MGKADLAGKLRQIPGSLSNSQHFLGIQTWKLERNPISPPLSISLFI